MLVLHGLVLVFMLMVFRQVQHHTPGHQRAAQQQPSSH